MRNETPNIPADVRRRRAWRLLRAAGWLAAAVVLLWDAVHGLQTGVVWVAGHTHGGPVARATQPGFYWFGEASVFFMGGLTLLFALPELFARLRDARAPSVTDADAPDPPPRVVTRPDGVEVFRDVTLVYTPTQVREAGLRVGLIMGGAFEFAFCMLSCMGWQGRPPAYTVDLWGWRAAAALVGATVLFYLLTAPSQPDKEVDRALREAGLPPDKPPRPLPFPAAPGLVLLLLLGTLGVYDRLAHRTGDALPCWIVASIAAAGLLWVWRIWPRTPQHPAS